MWTLHLRRSGFRDLESPTDPDAPLSNAGQPSHLHNRLRQDLPYPRLDDPSDGRPELLGRDRLHGFERYDRLSIEAAAEYYRRIEHLAWRFEDERDREIAVALSNGVGQMRIKVLLKCGQSRIERVMRQLAAWMKEPEETDGEE